MKIDYDAKLYKRIASLNLNEVVQVRNRKGIKSTIHIQNITNLSWHDMQLLISDGADKFTKMVLLYEKYVNSSGDGECLTRGENLTYAEIQEINEYIKIYHENGFAKHYEVNEYISTNSLWEQFPNIRSLNNHGDHKDIEGIQPKYFEIICQQLKISGENGLPLDAYRQY